MKYRKFTRRDFIKSSALTLALANSFIYSELSIVRAESSKKLKINVAGYDLEHVKPILEGRIEIEGCETQFQITGISDLNTHVFSGPQTRDITEIGLHPFMLAYANEYFRDYSLIPVFPL